jgi:hypothetical protein
MFVVQNGLGHAGHDAGPADAVHRQVFGVYNTITFIIYLRRYQKDTYRYIFS